MRLETLARLWGGPVRNIPLVAFMTTIGVNVGDEFIREGIASFLDEIFDEWSPLYVNKHELDTLSRRVYDETHSVHDKFRDADVIIQAGAPVYWKIGEGTSYNVEWAEELWEKRIFMLGPEKPVLNIAAGACQPFPDYAKTFLGDVRCVAFARKVDLACRWTSVRDPLASQILYALGIEHEVLPCAAFHAARRAGLPRGQRISNVIGINVMSLGGHYKLNDNIDELRWMTTIKSFLAAIRKYHRVAFIAHDQSEKTFAEQFVEGDDRILFSPQYRDYFQMYSQCSAVIANRVHGAVCAAGFGVPSMIIGNDSRLMIGDFIGIPSYYIANIDSGDIIEILESLVQCRKQEHDRLIALREESAVRYREAIMENIGNPMIAISWKSRGSSVDTLSKSSLASVGELESDKFRDFMKMVNCFAGRFGMRQFINWSRVWAYPWLWFNGLNEIDWQGKRVLDFGSELSPMPWLLASLGAQITMTASNPQWIDHWERLRAETGLPVDWVITQGDELPFADGSFDVVTSFSVIEYQENKALAIAEIERVLLPGGVLAISFDICEPTLGMTFPEWNGRALTMSEFEEFLLRHPAFDNSGCKPEWNLHDIPDFIEWHLKSAAHHNYTVGAAVIKKRKIDL